MLFRRFGRPGLLGLAARTAVVAGTASAVGGAMRNRQERAAQERAEADAWDAEQTVPMPPAPAVSAGAGADSSAGSGPGPGPGSGSGSSALLSELERLGRMQQQGLLTADEFAAAKQRLING